MQLPNGPILRPFPLWFRFMLSIISFWMSAGKTSHSVLYSISSNPLSLAVGKYAKESIKLCSEQNAGLAYSYHWAYYTKRFKIFKHDVYCDWNSKSVSFTEIDFENTETDNSILTIWWSAFYSLNFYCTNNVTKFLYILGNERHYEKTTSYVKMKLQIFALFCVWPIIYGANITDELGKLV